MIEITHTHTPHTHHTRSTLHKPRKSKLVFSFSLFLTPIVHHLLNVIKKFLGNNWLVASFVELAVEAESSIVKRIFEHSLDTGS